MADKENNQEPTLDQILKKARQNAHLDLKQLSELIKIPVKYLKLLEEGHYEKLPGRAYVLGFLTKYAKTFNLNKDEVIAQYKKERPEQTREEPLPLLRYPKFLITPKIITYFLIILAIIFALFYFWRQINFLTETPTLALQEPQQELVETPIITIKGLTNTKNKLTINDEEVYVNEIGEFQKEVMLQSGLNIFLITAINGLGKEKTITKNLWLKTNE